MDGRPNGRNKAAFSNYSSEARTLNMSEYTKRNGVYGKKIEMAGKLTKWRRGGDIERGLFQRLKLEE